MVKPKVSLVKLKPKVEIINLINGNYNAAYVLVSQACAEVIMADPNRRCFKFHVRKDTTPDVDRFRCIEYSRSCFECK
jgi:hypothetical protein